MPMVRIEDRVEAFSRTQSVEMRKFWNTYPRKVLTRPGAGQSNTVFTGRKPSLRFNLSSNSMYLWGP